ncbi:ureidoglycolate lyase [Candidatus Entotheonella palauensis]|uniref:ureidoglycolate lyase n=1 Tax=Candidatus Entotheonella palauensis TaxID=93172 RepID=UPI00211807F5|nr:ureidoglycolate lyase [Candidatus Entotheonella palauensis]
MEPYQLKVEPMTEETFGPYGVLMDAKARPKDHRAFFPIDFQVDGRTTVNVIWQPQQSMRFSKLERHFGVTQSFVQMSGAPAVVCAAAPTDMNDPQAIPEPDQIRAFLINPDTGYTFHRGTWHSLDRYLLAPPGGTFLILNTSPNPTQIIDYQEGTSVTYPDLETQANPVTVELKPTYGVTFELTL